MVDPTLILHEMQGLYGPYTIAERVVQKIWLRRDFCQASLRLQDGRPLSIRTPGAWNLLGGPDFRQARLLVGEEMVQGDVEVHFHGVDWRAHGHAHDHAYDNVVLHVVLFPPGAGEPPARRSDGSEIPTLVLLPLLHRSLEEYASDDALESLTSRDVVASISDLARMPADKLIHLLTTEAKRRWQQKLHYAELRINKLGWQDAAHHTALEILGYRRNRAAMLQMASRHPLPQWGGGLDLAGLYGEGGGWWDIQGVRPANHPRIRLKQYHDWVCASPDWPRRMLGVLSDFPEMGVAVTTTGNLRRIASLAMLRERLVHAVLSGAVGGSRMDTLVCDGFLPLGALVAQRDLWPCWFHWFLGDVPFDLRRSLGMLGVAGRGARPHCHGWAQGLLGWMAGREARASG